MKSKKENKLYATSNDWEKGRAAGDSVFMLDFRFFLFFLSQCNKSYQRLILQQSQKSAGFPLSPLTILTQDQVKELFKDYKKEGW